MNWMRRHIKLTAALLAAAALGLLLAYGRLEYAYIPKSGNGPKNEQVQLGRRTFYSETFGNEVFFTDILGILDGPLTIPNLVRALLETGGRGTENLEVRVSRDVTIGGQTFRKGQKVKTGLDVPRGAWVPLGLPVSYQKGRIKVGITCAACHATVHPQNKTVMDGLPNADLDAGLLLAFASNSAAYFPHAGKGALDTFATTASLPDPVRLENATDADFLRWPPGSFDASTDLESNPTQITDLFTRGEHPYGWTGFAAVGPFHGLTAFNNNFTRDSDALTQADASQALWGIPREAFLGAALQRSATRAFRYDPAGSLSPSAFFARVDPTPGTPGVVEATLPPSYPRVSPVAPGGLFIGSPRRKLMEQADALSAFQNSLVPPAHNTPAAATQGRAVFAKAGCAACHAGPQHTNHQVIPAPEIGTEPSHAASLRAAAGFAEGLTPGQLALSWAQGALPGGYKVPGLAGLAWTAPYLHDGGVAVGPPPRRQGGVAATLKAGIRPDPAESLRALLDRAVRAQVLEANRASADLRAAHVDGRGHAFWADGTAGFTPADQAALIGYLLAGLPAAP